MSISPNTVFGQNGTPDIARDFLFELSARRQSGKNVISADAARRYLEGFPESLVRAGDELDKMDTNQLTAGVESLTNLCLPLEHQALTVLCEQLAEMVEIRSFDTARSLLALIEMEDERLRPELIQLARDAQFETSHSRATRVMVVDDDPFTREIAQGLLESNGFSIQLQSSGHDALESLKQLKPDIVLLDINMPGIDGPETCRRIRALEDAEHLPVVMMTGSQDSRDIKRSFESQATDFVEKPVNWPILIQRIRYLVRSSKTLHNLYTAQKRLSESQNIARIGHWDHDLSQNQLLLSDQFYEVIGHPPGAFNGFQELLQLTDEVDHAALTEAFCKHRKSYVCECRIRSHDDKLKNIRIKGSSVYSTNNEPLWVLGTVQDVSDQRRDQEIIHRLAYYDDLTGLLNRTAFNREMEQALNLHARLDVPVAIVFMDLDGFKRINDSLGHHSGDLLLKAFANRLTANLRTTDLISQEVSPTLARLGGDEFTLMLSGLKRQEDATIVVQRIIDSLQHPFLLEAESNATESRLKEVYISTSMGIAIYPRDGTSLIELQKNADMAMYAAKEAGKNVFRYYQPSMNSDAQEHLQLETLLRRALENNELSLQYQPQVEILTGRIVGVEALLRWHNSEVGHVSPAQFIPVAEETGLIVPIGEWVLRQACDQLARWQHMGMNEIDIAVNLSGLQFRQAGFVQLIDSIINEAGINATRLELELTESMLMGQIEFAITTMEALKELGLKLSVDDFGTGFSSLSYLKKFPIDTLKIDRSFINEIGDDSSGEAITKAIVAMGHGLGLTLVAEGVETHQQLEFLTREECHLVQGFLYSRPLSAQQFEAYYQGSSQATEPSLALPSQG
ncbi:MAG: EAL domain-containing protein [Immundisolibacteraceae bacterium]|nr:EAL domain-containing protein [Immundisolibacteraceae bacterium]